MAGGNGFPPSLARGIIGQKLEKQGEEPSRAVGQRRAGAKEKSQCGHCGAGGLHWGC